MHIIIVYYTQKYTLFHMLFESCTIVVFSVNSLFMLIRRYRPIFFLSLLNSYRIAFRYLHVHVYIKCKLRDACVVCIACMCIVCVYAVA